jgi:ElaB/YqjD/DUF883 family membrane-anchored ribosome-binding protein
MTQQNLASAFDDSIPAGATGNGSAAEASKSAFRAAALEMKTTAANLADQAAAKAKEAYRQSRVMADQRAEQARAAIVERPWAAAGVIFLAGIIVGRALMGGAPKVIYLRDRG